MAAFDEVKFKKLEEAHAKHLIVGIADAAGVAPRQDIDVFLDKNPQTFNLLLIALYELQNDKNTKDPMGYFQIAGIHGAPKASWDGFGLKQNAGNTSEEQDPSGYCAHSTPKFPTWHRPYLSMMEQTLYIKMVHLAKQYKPELVAGYLQAAQQFRLPFWDYFRPRGGRVSFPGVFDSGETTFPYDYSLPQILTEENISVHMYPDDTLKRLDRNPFKYYSFISDSIPKKDWDVFAKDTKFFPRSRTARYPSPNSEKIVENPVMMNQVINELRMDSNRLVLTMMEDEIYGYYDGFASGAKQQNPIPEPPNQSKATEFVRSWPSGSLESLHGMYHVLVGGFGAYNEAGGHMSRVGVAAFDPVFWLHHCQIDRLFAIWQAIHYKKPQSWFSSRSKAAEGLLPFRKVPGNKPENCWTSNDSVTTEKFGYNYPVINGGTGTDVWKRFNDMYVWSVPLLNTDPWRDPPEEMKPLVLSKSDFFKEPAVAQKETNGTNGTSGTPKPKVEAQHVILSQRVLPKAVQVKAAIPPMLIQAAAAPAGPASAPTAPSPAAAVATPEAPVSQAPTSSAPTPEFSREWYIDDEVHRLALNGAFTIFYLLLPPSSPLPPLSSLSSSTLLLSPYLAGLTHIFAAPTQSCDNCGQHAEQAHTVRNTVPITSLLLDFVATGTLASLEPEDVKPFLVERLKWRVVGVNGEGVDGRVMGRERGLRVGVSCKVGKLPRGSGVERYEEFPEVGEEILGRASERATGG